MSKSHIFLDRDRLSPRYIPRVLPHRDRQIKILLSLYEDVLDHIEDVFLRVSQIVGGVGTGKTCTVIRFGEQFEKYASERNVKLRHVYLNCKIEGTSRYVLYGNLLRKVAPEISTRSLSPEEMLHQLVRYLREEEKYLIISIDEIDYFLKLSKEHIVYDLTRLQEMEPDQQCPVVGEIFISRDLSFHNELEPSELSSLGRGIIEFPRYTSQQIKDILDQRVSEAFRPGVVIEDVLNLIGDITARPPVNGDIRVALDLLLYSGILAHNLGVGHVLLEHVRKVYGETNPTITTEDLLDLDENGRLILLGIVRSLRSRNTPYIGLREIHEGYSVICEEHGIKPIKKVEEYVQDLCYRGIVDIKSLTEIGISGVSAEELERFLIGIIQRLKSG